MKSARILLVLACLLIAMTVPAVAYAPTNGAALGSTFKEIKINAKEEVAVTLIVDGERSAIPAVPIPGMVDGSITDASASALIFYYSKVNGPWRIYRAVARFT